jgi:hypothetical protein
MPPSISLTPDAVAGLVFLVTAGIVFWWGFIASARAFARRRHGRLGVVLASVALVIFASYARAHRDWANLQLLNGWAFLWWGVVVWLRLDMWRWLVSGVERCVGKLRAALGAPV